VLLPQTTAENKTKLPAQ